MEKTDRDADDWLPRTLMLLGTDAAGKNHVAQVWVARMRELGLDPILQEGWLANPPADPGHDTEKSALSHLAERTFLALFPWIAWGMPFALRFLLRRDARRFRSHGGREDGRRRLVVSHSALRILAFCLGARRRGLDALSESTRRAVRELHESSQALVIVLDVDHEVRQRRIEGRLARHDSDPFDRYMLADPDRSERIEACLVELAVELMGAYLIVNDALDDDALWAHLEEACQAGAGLPPGRIPEPLAS